MSAPPKPSRPNPPVISFGPHVGPEEEARVTRHAALLDLWRPVPLTELLTDLNVLIQLIQFRDQQDKAPRPS